MEINTSIVQAPATNLAKVYIVEDDVFLGRVLTEQVKAIGIDVERFMSAEDAMKAIETTVPDLILLDIFLPGQNGLDMLEELRKKEYGPKISVIVVSNTDDAKDRLRAQGLGAAFLIKAATTPDEIVGHVQDALAKRTV
jgi:two-component system alkaline phosphatase synthesis response regulator PhoP